MQSLTRALQQGFNLCRMNVLRAAQTISWMKVEIGIRHNSSTLKLEIVAGTRGSIHIDAIYERKVHPIECVVLQKVAHRGKAPVLWK